MSVFAGRARLRPFRHVGDRLRGVLRRLWRGRCFEFGNTLYEARDDVGLPADLLFEEGDAILQRPEVGVTRLSRTRRA
jgi:hypothetical protein